MVERRWQAACKTENESCSEDPVKYTVLPLLPTDSELAAAFAERKRRSTFTSDYNYVLYDSLIIKNLVIIFLVREYHS